MKVTLENNELVIRIPTTAPTLSASGKTKSVASSHGNITTSVIIDGKPVTVGVNAYIKA